MLVRVNFMLSIAVFMLILLNYFTNLNTSPLFITSLIGVVVLLIGVENIRTGSKFNGISFMVGAGLLFLVSILGLLGVV
ncbi:hypothetical protein [Alkalibacillus silvisoli]|uniref:DUF3953 domain-containing protein n=1 Tax=Alkalibacillus silvisoli TaxID=392823 RepID=A0ABN0ZLF0_9BACI